MKAKDLRNQEVSELDFQLKEMRQRIFDLRFKASDGISDTKELRRLRRDVARILTVKGDRERQPKEKA